MAGHDDHCSILPQQRDAASVPWHDVGMTQKKGGGRQSGNPAARNNPKAPAPQPTTGGLQQASAPVILFLSRFPRWVFPLVMALLLLGGLLISNGIIGGILLLLLVLVLVWLTALSWNLLTTVGKLLRIITIGAALAVTIARFTGKM
jgi:hypothetical protein